MSRDSKYDPSKHPELLKWMGRCGLTNPEIAKELGISLRTLTNWQNRHPAVQESLKYGKDLADAVVEDSLYQRAVGFSYTEKKIISKPGDDGDLAVVKEEETLKRALPETLAMIFWLKNRQPQRWREKQERHMTHTLQIILPKGLKYPKQIERENDRKALEA